MLRPVTAKRVALIVLAIALASCSSEAPTLKSLLKEGEHCGRDDECETGLCVALPAEEKVCRRKCEAGCRTAEICTTFGETAKGGLRAGCVPDKAGLCRPCASDDECAYPADACLALGSEYFCGRDCSWDGGCPDGYACTESRGTFGSMGKQCQPRSGSCACTPATVGQERPCVVENTFGTCRGDETCDGASGFVGCDARVPAAEACNGVDDDCDGEVDEGFADLECGKGECRATVRGCVDGKVPRCEPRPAGTETCDGRDEDCDGVIDNGFDLTTLANCGACGRACAVEHGTPKCASGACAIDHCGSGWSDCDLEYATGCETHTDVDLRHCGGCNSPCAPPNAEPACEAAVCRIARCLPGFEDCDGDLANGCEVDLTRDPANCGTCGNACAAANAASACVAGRCAITACTPPFQDCDALYGNGCESNTSTDLRHCGGCGTACPTRANATRTCDGSCGYACTGSFQDCNGLASDGCESDRLADLANCGACNRACPDRPNSARTCNGTCGFTCTGTYKDCDALASNGCEANTNSDVMHCGACGRACSAVAHATAQCSGAACVPVCASGWANCDASYATGCEKRLDAQTVPPNCGGVSDLGAMSGDTGSGRVSRTGSTEATFKFRLTEDDGSVFSRKTLTARMELGSPPGVEYDVYVSDHVCGQNQAQYSPPYPGGTVAVDICQGDSFGTNEGFDVYVEVVYRSGTGCGSWTLTVTGNVADAACAN